MTGPYSIAKASLAQALGEAEAADIEAPRLLKAFLQELWPPISSITASPIFAANWSLSSNTWAGIRTFPLCAPRLKALKRRVRPPSF